MKEKRSGYMDADLTKQVFTKTFKKMLNDYPFSKITISKLCNTCNMNRTSFYYHFQDKYDMVCWIYDRDMAKICKDGFNDNREFVKAVATYFYDNRDFYRKVFTFTGDNPFSIHLKEQMRNVLNDYLLETICTDNNLDFYRIFFEDAIICSVERWLNEDNCMLPEKYLSLIESCLHISEDKE